MQIWKYPLRNIGTNSLSMPVGAVVLDVQAQTRHAEHRGGTVEVVTLWAWVDPDCVLEERTFLVTGTGHDLPEACYPDTYLGTVQAGTLVWHVFEVTE